MSTTTAEPQRTAASASNSVPWSTVIPTAVAMALADGFWIISLRGAVGAVEAGGHPFASWLRGSAAAAPAFAALVLAALGGVARHSGVGRREPAATVTFAAVVGAGTLAGAGWLAYESGRAYVVQMSELHLMQAMGSTCNAGPCVGRAESAVLVLQLRALAYGAVILLVTNAVVTLWVIAMRGGRIDAGTIDMRSTSDPGGTGRPGDPLAVLLAVLLLGAAAIHGAVVPAHLTEWPAAGWFFAALLSAEVLAAAALVLPSLARRPSTAWAVAVISLGPLLVWALSRSMGMPFGPTPWEVEPVGVADSAACLLMLATLALAVGRARGRGGRWRASTAHTRWVALLLVLAVTCVGLAGTGLATPDSQAPPAMESHG